MNEWDQMIARQCEADGVRMASGQHIDTPRADYPTPTSQRVRIVGGPWPERIGMEGVACRPPSSGCYPQPSPGEVLVLLDNDPIRRGAFMGVDYARADASWSCCMKSRDVVYLDGENQ